MTAWHPLVEKYRENIQLIVSGHWHRWFEFGRKFGRSTW